MYTVWRTTVCIVIKDLDLKKKKYFNYNIYTYQIIKIILFLNEKLPSDCEKVEFV